MNTINPSLYSGQYYQLPDTSAAGLSGNASLLTSAAPAGAAPPTAAYLLDLSSTAQDYLSGLTNPAAGSAAASSNSSFLLSPAQQQTLNGILAKYKNLPMTQQNYTSLQNDLKAAGLGPDQLSLQEQAKSFNATQVLLDALNGQSTALSAPGSGNSQEQSKADNYMSHILQQWQNMAPPAATGAATRAAASQTV